MHHNLLLTWLAAFLNEVESRKKAANQANSKINYDASIILVMYLKKIVYLRNLLCMLEFYTTLLFFLASQWFHTFKSFSNLHFLGLAFFTSEMFLELDITSFLRQHKSQKYMYALCRYKLLIQRIQGGLSIQVPFKTGSTVIVHHKNNDVLIPPQNQLTSISWRNLPFTFFIQ